MKQAAVVLIVAFMATGCSMHARMTVMETAGVTGGQFLADYVRAEYGVHTPEMRRVGELAMALDQSTVILSATGPLSPLDALAVRRIVARTADAIGQSDPPDSIQKIIESGVSDVMSYLRSADSNREARTLAMIFTGSAALAIRERLDSWRAIEEATEGGAPDGP